MASDFPPDPVAVALALVEDRCVPHVFGGRPFDAAGLVRLDTPVAPRLVEPRSRMAVDFGTGCEVTDALAPLGEAARARLVAGAEDLGRRLFEDPFVHRAPEGAFEVMTFVGSGRPEGATDILAISFAPTLSEATRVMVGRPGFRPSP